MPTEMFYTVSRKIMEDDFRGFWAEQNVQHHGANLNNSFQTIATLDGTSLATKRFDFSAFSQLMLAAQHGLGVWPDWGDPPHIQSSYRSTDVKLTWSWCVTCCLPNPQGATCVHGAWVVAVLGYWIWSCKDYATVGVCKATCTFWWKLTDGET